MDHSGEMGELCPLRCVNCEYWGLFKYGFSSLLPVHSARRRSRYSTSRIAV
jgi:hypothetical protein